jgi:hypothetical protein
MNQGNQRDIGNRTKTNKTNTQHLKTKMYNTAKNTA